MSVIDHRLETPEATPSHAVAWCQQCGLALGEAEIQYNLALVLARCCPRCDGPLEEHVPAVEPAVYLG